MVIRFLQDCRFALALLGVFAILLCGCDSSERKHGANRINDPQESSSSSAVVEKKLQGMLYVESSKPVALGTDDTSASAKVQPEMKVELAYGFYIGRTEVTMQEFKFIMDSGFGPEDWDFVKKYSSDSALYPMTNVSYYDAVLYANAKSKSERYDTAYTYKSASFDIYGACTNLEGLVFHPEANAYRLPTEAEWTLAASRRWDPEKGWNASNSDHALHEVCTAKDVAKLDSAKRDSAFCDMAGNALEWVNDWLGAFMDTTLVNFIGASNGGSLGERVLKGGSFNDKASTIKLYNRGDVYTVTSSSKAAYVGFRLAFGKIPDALWTNGDGSVTSSRIDVLVKSSTVGATVGTYKAKLVFRDDLSGNLAYVDFSNGNPTVVEIRDTLDSYHPDISPDGKKVAFCTGLEGVSGKSAVYVRNLSPSGNNLVPLKVESAAIPRWRVLDNGDTVIVYVSDAGNNKDESGFSKKSTWQVVFSGGKFGKPVKLFDGAYHGGISYDDRLAVSGARILRARIAEKKSTVMETAKDTVWYGGEQACNVSLSKDKSKRSLFLDFGGDAGHKFTDSDYGTHEMLLVADSTGKLIRGIPAPSGMSFDHSEWVSRALNASKASSDMAVVTLVNESGAHSKIALVNVADSNIVEIAEGAELWHPNLWVYSGVYSASDSVFLDSAGVYFGADDEMEYRASAIELGYKMQRFWESYKDVEYIAFGSSMTLNAVIEDSIKAFKALNMAYTLGDTHGFNYLLKNYVFPYALSLKVISVELTPGFMFQDEKNMWKQMYETSPGFVYDRRHLDAQFDAIVENAKSQEFTRDMFSTDYLEDSFLLPSKGWAEPVVYVDTSLMYTTTKVFKANFEIFRDLKKTAEQLGIKFFVHVTPRNPDYKDSGAFGFFGPRWVVAETIFDMFEEEGFLIFDENRMGDHDYSEDMAFNCIHLSAEGAIRFTARLDSLLETLK